MSEGDFVQQRTHPQNGCHTLQILDVCCPYRDVHATNVVRNVWIVGEETDKFADSKTIRTDIVIIKGNVGIEMSFDKVYEFGVALRACLEST